MLKLKKESNLLKNVYLQVSNALLICSLIFLSHCSHLDHRREKPTKIISSPQKVIYLHKAEVSKRKKLKAEGRIRLKHKRRKYAFDFLLATQTPSSSRFEASHPLGGTLAILVTNPAQYIYYEIEENKVYKGRNRIPVLPTYFPYEFTTKEFVGCLTHSFPLPKKPSHTKLTYNEKENAYQLTFQHKKRTWDVSLDPTHFYLLSISIRNPDKTLYFSLQYERFKKTDHHFYFPHIIRISSPSNKADLELEFHEVTFPEKLNPQLFIFEK